MALVLTNYGGNSSALHNGVAQNQPVFCFRNAGTDAQNLNQEVNRANVNKILLEINQMRMQNNYLIVAELSGQHQDANSLIMQKINALKHDSQNTSMLMLKLIHNMYWKNWQWDEDTYNNIDFTTKVLSGIQLQDAINLAKQAIQGLDVVNQTIIDNKFSSSGISDQVSFKINEKLLTIQQQMGYIGEGKKSSSNGIKKKKTHRKKKMIEE